MATTTQSPLRRIVGVEAPTNCTFEVPPKSISKVKNASLIDHLTEHCAVHHPHDLQFAHVGGSYGLVAGGWGNALSLGKFFTGPQTPERVNHVRR